MSVSDQANPRISNTKSDNFGNRFAASGKRTNERRNARDAASMSWTRKSSAGVKSSALGRAFRDLANITGSAD